jgi:hypothetical protein
MHFVPGASSGGKQSLTQQDREGIFPETDFWSVDHILPAEIASSEAVAHNSTQWAVAVKTHHFSAVCVTYLERSGVRTGFTMGHFGGESSWTQKSVASSHSVTISDGLK